MLEVFWRPRPGFERGGVQDLGFRVYCLGFGI